MRKRIVVAVVTGAVLRVAPSVRAQASEDTLRIARWREDVRFFGKELVARHKNAFAYTDRPTFARAVADLDSAVPKLTDNQIMLRMARVAALLRDGHTSAPAPLYPNRMPFRVYWFDDGPYIADATDEHRALIGSRILSINGHDIREVADSLRPYVSSENELGFRWLGPGLMVRPALIRDIGIGGSGREETLDLVKDGTRSTVTVAAVPIAGFTLPARDDAPPYRRRPGEKYWWTYLPAERTIFVKYNQCVDFDAFRKMADSIAAAIDAEHPLRVVVDIRDNPGGNSTVVQPLIKALQARPDVNRKDALYVAMGRGTFSSGMLAAWDFRRHTNATLIGEPTGERPNTYGEVAYFALPNSGLHINYSTKFFRMAEGEPESYVPDVLVPPTPEAYFAQRDPVMDWILAHSRGAER